MALYGKRDSAISAFLFIIAFICGTLLIPIHLSAEGISIPGSKIPQEFRDKPSLKKAPLPSQLYGLRPDPAKVLHLPPLDVSALIAEDRVKRDKGKPQRAGIHQEISVSPATHGEWYEVGKGSLWLFEIHAPLASGIDVHFTNVNLPQGSMIYVYSPSNMETYQGPFKGGPALWGGTVWDDKVIIEVIIPASFDRSKHLFDIDGVSEFYRPLKSRSSYKRGYQK